MFSRYFNRLFEVKKTTSNPKSQTRKTREAPRSRKLQMEVLEGANS